MLAVKPQMIQPEGFFSSLKAICPPPLFCFVVLLFPVIAFPSGNGSPGSGAGTSLGAWHGALDERTLYYTWGDWEPTPRPGFWCACWSCCWRRPDESSAWSGIPVFCSDFTWKKKNVSIDWCLPTGTVRLRPSCGPRDVPSSRKAMSAMAQQAP